MNERVPEFGVIVHLMRRYLEHLQGKHNQKSHGNKYGSTDAVKANVKRLGGDKAALKSMAARVRKDNKSKSATPGNKGGKATASNLNNILASANATQQNAVDVLKNAGFRVQKWGLVGGRSGFGKDSVLSPDIKELRGLPAYRIESVIPKSQGGGGYFLGVIRGGRLTKLPKKSVPDWEYLDG